MLDSGCCRGPPERKGLHAPPAAARAEATRSSDPAVADASPAEFAVGGEAIAGGGEALERLFVEVGWDPGGFAAASGAARRPKPNIHVMSRKVNEHPDHFLGDHDGPPVADGHDPTLRPR